MGNTSGCNTEGVTESHTLVRDGGDAGPFNKDWPNLAKGEAHRFKQTTTHPNSGDRFGQLTVLGTERVKIRAGWIWHAKVQCGCGAAPHFVYLHNLLRGKSTQCNICAKKSAATYRKNFWKYASVCPDTEHRRRLLNRLASCKSRCHNPKDQGYHNYGGRGIQLYAPWRTDKAAFLTYVCTLDDWDKPNLDLDRIDVNKGYEPGNLRFVTRRENCKNKRSMRGMQLYIAELEARIRHLEQRAP